MTRPWAEICDEPATMATSTVLPRQARPTDTARRRKRLTRRRRPSGGRSSTNSPGARASSPTISAGLEPTIVQELFANDIGVTAMLRQLAECVEIHPAKWDRAALVAVEYVVQGQLRGDAA